MTKLRTFAFVSAWVFAIACAGFLPVQISAQKPVAATAGNAAQTLSLKSNLMGREMPYRIILPKDYNATFQQAQFLTNSPALAAILKPASENTAAS